MNGELQVLPIIGYHTTPEHPIRTEFDKFRCDEEGKTRLAADQPGGLKATCPAIIDNSSRIQLEKFSRSLHLALGCRHYSLFDFRIKEGSNEVFFLEAGLFWTFSPRSVISQMLQADGQNLVDVYDKIWKQALLDWRKGRNC